MGDSQGIPWLIKPRHHFSYFEDASLEAVEDSFQARLLVHVDADGLATDTFRLKVFGRGSLTGSFCSDDVFANPDLRGYHFSFEVRAEDIDLKTNTCCSSWTNILDLVESGVLQVSKKGTKDAQEEFRGQLEAVRHQPGTEAAIRWGLMASSTENMKLILAALPRSKSILKKNLLFTADSCPIIELASFPLPCDMVSEGPLTGPKPILFSTAVEASIKAISNNKFKTYKGIQEVLRGIPEPERFHLQEAEIFCKNPLERVKVYPYGAEDICTEQQRAKPDKGIQNFRKIRSENWI